MQHISLQQYYCNVLFKLLQYFWNIFEILLQYCWNNNLCYEIDVYSTETCNRIAATCIQCYCITVGTLQYYWDDLCSMSGAIFISVQSNVGRVGSARSSCVHDRKSICSPHRSGTFEFADENVGVLRNTIFKPRARPNARTCFLTRSRVQAQYWQCHKI